MLKALARKVSSASRLSARSIQNTPEALYDTTQSVDNVAYGDDILRLRKTLPIYELEPVVIESFIAPNATVAGEVHL